MPCCAGSPPYVVLPHKSKKLYKNRGLCRGVKQQALRDESAIFLPLHISAALCLSCSDYESGQSKTHPPPPPPSPPGAFGYWARLFTCHIYWTDQALAETSMVGHDSLHLPTSRSETLWRLQAEALARGRRENRGNVLCPPAPLLPPFPTPAPPGHSHNLNRHCISVDEATLGLLHLQIWPDNAGLNLSKTADTGKQSQTCTRSM